MSVVTISSRCRVVIPRDIRERMTLKPGQELRVMSRRGRIQMIPLEPIEALRGFLPGIDTTIERDPDRLEAERNPDPA